MKRFILVAAALALVLVSQPATGQLQFQDYLLHGDDAGDTWFNTEPSDPYDYTPTGQPGTFTDVTISFPMRPGPTGEMRITGGSVHLEISGTGTQDTNEITVILMAAGAMVSSDSQGFSALSGQASLDFDLIADEVVVSSGDDVQLQIEYSYTGVDNLDIDLAASSLQLQIKTTSATSTVVTFVLLPLAVTIVVGMFAGVIVIGGWKLVWMGIVPLAFKFTKTDPESNDTRSSLMRAIGREAGITPAELSARTGTSRLFLAGHLDILVGAGRIQYAAKGMKRRFSLVGEAIPVQDWLTDVQKELVLAVPEEGLDRTTLAAELGGGKQSLHRKLAPLFRMKALLGERREDSWWISRIATDVAETPEAELLED